jgi:hypothetical protein
MSWEPEFQTLIEVGAYSLRRYESFSVTQVMVQGERQAAINEGFRQLADYIFGANANRTKIPMTIPVRQCYANREASQWQVEFVVPPDWTPETLPQPKNTQIQFKVYEPSEFAVIRFNGSPKEVDFLTQEENLLHWLQQKGRFHLGEPIYAFYNPPWTLPFMRRNEILWQVN